MAVLERGVASLVVPRHQGFELTRSFIYSSVVLMVNMRSQRLNQNTAVSRGQEDRRTRSDQTGLAGKGPDGCFRRLGEKTSRQDDLGRQEAGQRIAGDLGVLIQVVGFS